MGFQVVVVEDKGFQLEVALEQLVGLAPLVILVLVVV